MYVKYLRTKKTNTFGAPQIMLYFIYFPRASVTKIIIVLPPKKKTNSNDAYIISYRHQIVCLCDSYNYLQYLKL